MKELLTAELGTALLAAASTIVLVSNAAEKILKAYKAAKAPNDRQNERLDSLENWKEEVNHKLSNDNERLGTIEEGNRATQRAILALLDHGIDGNNVEQMQEAKKSLQNHLINR